MARRYLVDTGASFSLVPHKSNKTPARQPRLIGPNGQPIKCWGEENRRLHIGGRPFEWKFLLADVTFPILGVDFLRANRLAVDVGRNALIDTANGDTFSLIGQPSGHTASVMLPANVPRSEAESASPPATRPTGGSWVANGSEAARGPRHHGTGELRRRGSRGGKERGLHLHQEAAAPSRCSRTGQQRQGGCNLRSTFTTATANHGDGGQLCT
jgi:hypothetical protein